MDEETRDGIVHLAEAMLAGKLSYLDGATQILQYRFWSDVLENGDPHFLVFVGIDSETDHLPRSEQRQFWSSEALEKLKPEIASAEIWAQSLGKPACEALLNRFKEA